MGIGAVIGLLVVKLPRQETESVPVPVFVKLGTGHDHVMTPAAVAVFGPIVLVRLASPSGGVNERVQIVFGGA